MTVPLSISRRRLLATAAAGALGTSAGSGPRPALAEGSPVTLVAGRRTLDVHGRAASVFGITQPDGTSGLFADVGTPFRVTLRNESGTDTLIHWHGLTPPSSRTECPTSRPPRSRRAGPPTTISR